MLFILGTVSGIVSGVFVEPYLTPTTNAAQYLTSISEGGMQVMVGAFLVFTMGISLALIPVFMYPVLKRYNEPLAIAYLVFRGALEFVMYLALMGVLLTILAVSRDSVFADTTTGAFDSILVLVAGYEVVYYVLLTLVFAIGALIFYFALYRTELVPRWLAGWGLLAALLWLSWGVAGVFGLFDPAATLRIGISLPTESVFALPIALQEMVMAVWLIVRGFNQSVIESLDVAETAPVR
ncbi:hypothetical protein AUR66_03015 [Haloferax profundi]|uniref:DUF4386 domain-containing protein n=1 Tax=Haloferax profundi TaxID=1544718 RepID=A0A0W1RN96_9EURY|nr:hypothetical protein AUR66_03015 [Haloferax profundi]